MITRAWRALCGGSSVGAGGSLERGGPLLLSNDEVLGDTGPDDRLQHASVRRVLGTRDLGCGCRAEGAHLLGGPSCLVRRRGSGDRRLLRRFCARNPTVPDRLLGEGGLADDLTDHLRVMRAAGRRFLDKVQLSPLTEGDGTALLTAVAGQGLDGVVAKRLDSTYEPGATTKDWLVVSTAR